MGKDKQALQKLPKSFTRDDLLRVIEETARAAAKDTVKAIDDMNKRNERRSCPGKTAQRMLSEYRRLKIAVKEDIQISEAEGLEMRWSYLQDLMGAPNRDMIFEDTAYARERKLQYSNYKVQRIEAAVDMYRRECKSSGSEEAMRRFRVVWMKYMEDTAKTVEEIAESENISDKTVYKDLGIAYKAIGVYLSAT